MLKGVDHPAQSCDNFDLTISIGEIEVVRWPVTGDPY